MEAVREIDLSTRDFDRKFEKRTDTNSQQIAAVVEQGNKMEQFIGELIGLVKECQDSQKKVREQVFEFDRNGEIFKREIGEMQQDFENRYKYFQECIQGDVSTIMRTQRDTNEGLEKFIEMVEERTSSFEQATSLKLEGFEEEVKKAGSNKVESGSGGSIDIEKKISKVAVDNQQSQEKLEALSNKFENFRNEINKLLVGFENDFGNKDTQFANAITAISRKLGIQNPLV